MESTTLGQNEIAISRIGFGGDPMGGHGWGATDSGELHRAVATAVDIGINFFDTADVYGLGQSEALLGEALKHKRAQSIIATKFGVRVESGKTWYDNSPAWTEQALDASLRRLQTDYVDLYQLHYWDEQTPIDDIVATLEAARRKGKVRLWGVTNLALSPQILAASEVSPASFSYEFSLAMRTREAEILSTVRQTGRTFMSWGTLGQGILTGKYDAASRFDDTDRRNRQAYVNFSAAGRMRNLRIVDVMREIQRRHPTRSLAQIALRWVLDRVPNSVALVGIKRTSQIEDAAGACGWKLTAEDMQALDAISRPDPAHETQPDEVRPLGETLI